MELNKVHIILTKHIEQMENKSFNNWQEHIAKELSKDYKKLYYSAKYTKKKEVKKVLLSKN
jgi:hypothetical protein